MELKVHTVHQRLAELWAKKKKRGYLTEKEKEELEMCLDWNVTYCWNIARLRTLSFLAHETNDVEWQHQICAEIDRLT